jgi:hypothetical protein
VDLNTYRIVLLEKLLVGKLVKKLHLSNPNYHNRVHKIFILLDSLKYKVL